MLHAVHQVLDANDPDAILFVNAINWFLMAFGMSRETASLSRRTEKVSGEHASNDWVLSQTDRGVQLLASGQFADATEIFSSILQILGDDYNVPRNLDSELG